ncbi:hypothetical protein M8C21_017249, partial [Ambrosia artemisiifolia]
PQALKPVPRAFYFYNYHDIFPTTKITIEATDFREWAVTFGRSEDDCAYHQDGSVVDFDELQSVANAATPSHVVVIDSDDSGSLPASTSVSAADIFSNKSKGEKGQFYIKAKIQKRMQITNALAKASGLKPGMSLNIKFDDQAPVKAEVGTEKNGCYKKRVVILGWN